MLGIDAAWTPTQPSGVALVAREDGRWRLRRAASSYSAFIGDDDTGGDGGYPHPALVELAQETRRLPYKAAKLRTYWPALAPDQRRAKLVTEWRRIVGLLDREIDGSTTLLQVPLAGSGGRALKAFEDMLDAVVCAWVGICVLEDRAIPFGDHDSAIWIPAPGGIG